MREKVSKWISFPVKSTFLVAFLYEHLKQLKVKGTNVLVYHMKEAAGHASASVAEAAVSAL